MAELQITEKTREKLQKKHGVGPAEVLQCFKNRDASRKILFDTREEHKTDPATCWFLAKTNTGRLLKICFIPPHPGNAGAVEIKTAFEPNEQEIRIYEKHSK